MVFINVFDELVDVFESSPSFLKIEVFAHELEDLFCLKEVRDISVVLY